MLREPSLLPLSEDRLLTIARSWEELDRKYRLATNAEADEVRELLAKAAVSRDACVSIDAGRVLVDLRE